MDVTGDYETAGYLHVRELIPPEVARAILRSIKDGLGPEPLELSGVTQHQAQLKRPAFNLYGYDFWPMIFFLWGLTPTISRLVGRDLLPAYDYFRIYREGDVCRVHSDRESCEHSVSLTLDYSDGEVWDLQVSRERRDSALEMSDDFGSDRFASVAMNVGDAVIYRGVHHRHGRVTRNPNEWSAHLFLHYVERGGRYADHAFDKRMDLRAVNFSFS